MEIKRNNNKVKRKLYILTVNNRKGYSINLKDEIINIFIFFFYC